MKRFLSLGLVLLLVACGGGSGDNSNKTRSARSSSSIAQTSTSSINSATHVVVTLAISGNGQTQPSGPQTVLIGDHISFTITPDNGLYIASANGCGGNLQNQIFTTSNLFNDCQITVQFNQIGTVFISDEQVKNAIRNALGLSNNADITSAQIQNLTSLILQDAPSSITGLEAAVNLSTLGIYNADGNSRELDLTPITNLHKLTSLTLRGIDALSLSPISDLLQVVELDLTGSTATDLLPIANLTQLKSLILSDMQLDALPDSIGNLKQLLSIDLSNNFLDNSDIDFLSELSLQSLNLAYNNINQLTFLSNHAALNYLSVTGTPVFDLSPLLTSGLANGDFIFAHYTCVHYGKYASNPAVATQLRNKGIGLMDSFQEAGKYGGYGSNKKCENLLNDLTGTADANYQNNQVQLNWVFDDLSNKLICEVYFDLHNQQPRTPYAVIDNCQIESQSIQQTNFNQAPVALMVWDTFGSRKIIPAQITSSPPSTIYLQSYDWGQTIVKNDAKLIPNKPALLRLHILSTQQTPAPDIQVDALLNNSITNLSVNKPTQVTPSQQFNSLAQAYKVIVDKSLMQSGLSIRVTLAGEEKIITPNFGLENKLNITLVPIQIQNTLGTIPTHTGIKNAFLQTWPFSEINLKNRLAYTSSATAADDMENILYEIQELQILDGDNSHYYGFFSSDVYDLFNFNEFGGIAFIADTVGIGSDSDSDFSIMLHEMGHTFSLQHVNCGGPYNFDPLYPYNTNTIGSLGINIDFSNLFQPNSYRDMMSYCQPEFVSDYSYEKAQDYLEKKPSQPFSISSVSANIARAPAQKNLFISGVINFQSAELRRFIPVTRPITTNEQGKYELRIYDNQQLTQHYYFDTKTIDHIQDSGKFFSLIIPSTTIVSMEIWEGNKLLYREDNTASPGAPAGTYQKTNIAPLVTQTATSTCLTWDNKAYDSATLILHHYDEQSTLFIDTDKNYHCVNIGSVPNASQWHILLRKGLNVDEFWQTN